MSTTDASNSYAQADEYIQYKLQKARRRIKWADLLTAGLLAAVLLIGYVLVFTALDHWVVSGGFSPWTRAIGLGVVVALCGAILIRYVALPWFKTIHPLYAARILDSSGSGLKGALVSLVDLNSGPDQVSGSVRTVMEKRAAVSLSKVNVDDAIDQSWLMKLGATLFVLVVLTSIYAIASPKGINLLRPLTVANAAVATQTRILKVDPGTTTIAAGESLEVFVDVGGQIPEEVILEFTTRDKTYVNEALTLSATESDSKFQTIIVGESDRGLRQDFSYRIVAGDSVSEDFQVTVDQPPTSNVLELNYEYPSYMLMPPQNTADGNIAAWEGTRVQLIAEASVPLKRAVLKFSDSSTFDVPAEEVNLIVQEQQILGEFTLQLRDDKSSPKYYRIEVQDLDGRTDPQPTVYAVNIRPDKPPIVKLLDPIRDLNVPANSVIPLLVQAEDPDFMLRNVKLEYDINGELRTPEILYDGTRTALTQKWTGRFEFRLQDLEVRQGDVINYYVTARDNKPPLGTMSRTSNLKLVITEETTEEEVQKRLKQDREMQDQEFQEQTEQQQADSEQEDKQPGENQQGEGQQQEGEGSSDQTGKPGQQTNDSGKSDPNGNDQGASQNQQKDGSNENASQESGAPEDDSENQTENPDQNQAEPTEQNQTGDASGGKQNQKNQTGNAGPNETTSQENQTDDQGKPGATNSASQPTDSNQIGEQVNPDQGKAAESGESRPVDDGEAMQKLLEKYRNDNGNTEPPSETEQSNQGGDESAAGKNEQQDNGEANADTSAEDSGNATQNPADGGQEKGPDDPEKKNSNGEESNSETATDANKNSLEEPGTQQPGEGQPDQQQTGEKANPEQPNGEKKSGEQEGGEEKTGEQDGQKSGEEKSGEQGGQKGGEEKPGEQDGQKGGEEKSGEQDGQKGGEEKSGEQDGQKSGEEKSGEQDGQKGGEEKSGEQGGQKGGEEKSGEQGGQKGGEEKSGEQGGQKGGEEKSGEQGGQKGGEKKSGEQGGQKGGEKKSGEQGGQKGGEKKSGEQGGQKGGEKKSGEQGGKKGGEKKSGEQDGQKGGEQKSGEQGEKKGGEKKSGEQGGQKGGEKKSGEQGGKEGSGEAGKGQSGSSKGQQGGMGAKGGASGAPQGEASQSGTGTGAASEFQSDDPDVQSSAEATDLVLKRLQHDLQRGEVDQELLDELGWTQDQLKQFNSRMRKKLDSLKSTEDASSKAEQLRRRRAEELLKSLDLKSGSADRVGRDNRDVEQQDTTTRRSAPPARYKGWMELFQRGLSKGKSQPRE